MYDPEIIDLVNSSHKCNSILNEFKKDWFEFKFSSVEWPVLHRINNEFIIQVPRVDLKVQYIPFIYKEFKTEIIS